MSRPGDPAQPVDFQRGYSLVDDVIGDESNAIGVFKAYQLGFYARDELQVNDCLRITAGLCVDIPKITTKPRFADDVFTTTLTMHTRPRSTRTLAALPSESG